MSPVLATLLIPFLGTTLGSAFVFFMKRDMPILLQKTLLGFASGVMVAASVWSLIIPAIELGTGTLLHIFILMEIQKDLKVTYHEQPN